VAIHGAVVYLLNVQATNVEVAGSPVKKRDATQSWLVQISQGVYTEDIVNLFAQVTVNFTIDAIDDSTITAEISTAFSDWKTLYASFTVGQLEALVLDVQADLASSSANGNSVSATYIAGINAFNTYVDGQYKNDLASAIEKCTAEVETELDIASAILNHKLEQIQNTLQVISLLYGQYQVQSASAQYSLYQAEIDLLNLYTQVKNTTDLATLVVLQAKQTVLESVFLEAWNKAGILNKTLETINTDVEEWQAKVNAVTQDNLEKTQQIAAQQWNSIAEVKADWLANETEIRATLSRYLTDFVPLLNITGDDYSDLATTNPDLQLTWYLAVDVNITAGETLDGKSKLIETVLTNVLAIEAVANRSDVSVSVTFGATSKRSSQMTASATVSPSPTSPTSSSTSSNTDDNASDNTNAIIGGVVAAVVLLVIIVVIVVVVVKKKIDERV